ncbi:hypothetical protein Ddye_016820 [Dipteronia dyeriana]|uniref:DDE Tnp4 domain-containing protein n=1 Tax=Dipteronia dyeriana TaxID=168575 RepID=A0AAD9U7H2_9ROSI|nr:hypothetical protein Ddye_016820 [Dipteronia dyeriana]
MDVEENLELNWDDPQMDEEDNLGLRWGKNWEYIQETQDQSFRRFFSETISRHLHEVLRAIIFLEDQFLRQPNGDEVPQEIISSHRLYPYIKEKLMEHIRVKVSKDEAARYRERKDCMTQNVMEGTASDSRTIKNALARADRLIIPKEKIYLVDARYMLRSGLLKPYRGVRYHLKEYSARAPEDAQELFNHRHAALHNVIERTFGMLKKRFPIISGATKPHYLVKTIT